MGLTKATLTNVDTNEEIKVLFNPTEYSLEKTTSWGGPNNDKPVKGLNLPQRNFKGGNPQKLNLELFFDVFEQSNADVRTLYIEKLMKFTQIDPARLNPKTQKGRPPLCLFQWGASWHFKAAVTSLNVRYTLFREDGTPARATVKITLEEVEDESLQKKQNPSSYSEPGRKRREVRPQDTLAAIAYEEYGDASKWRAIAEDNRIDDPLSLQPGQVLSIPSLS